MRTKMIGGAALAVLLLVAASSGQDVRPTPGPGTGIVTVRGTVDIGNTPTVSAVQSGPWKVVLGEAADVRVTNTPTVAAAPPDFVKPGRRYSITWPSGQTEVIVAAQLGTGGWTRLEYSGPGARRRWVNLAGAQAVEELDR